MTIKLSMIGTRGHWNYVFQSIKDIENINLCAVSSGGKDSIAPIVETAKKYDFNPKIYDNYIEMLDTEKPDIVCISAEFEKHAEQSIECLKRNIHVFCEKPIALTLEDLEKVNTAYKASNAKIFSMIGLRYEPCFQTAINLIHDGAIGKVKIISTRKSYKLGVRDEYYKHRETYGGTIPWVGSHAIDWVMAASSCQEVKKVFAIDNAEDNFDNGQLEIVASCMFEMANGVIAQCSIDYLRPATAPTHGDDQLRVAGTKGVIEVREGIITLIDSTGVKNIVPIEKVKLFSDIVNSCIYNKTAFSTPEETIQLTKNCLLAQKFADNCNA